MTCVKNSQHWNKQKSGSCVHNSIEWIPCYCYCTGACQCVLFVLMLSICLWCMLLQQKRQQVLCMGGSVFVYLISTLMWSVFHKLTTFLCINDYSCCVLQNHKTNNINFFLCTKSFIYCQLNMMYYKVNSGTVGNVRKKYHAILHYSCACNNIAALCSYIIACTTAQHKLCTSCAQVVQVVHNLHVPSCAQLHN